MKKLMIILLLCLSAPATQAEDRSQPDNVKEPELRRELLERFKTDQEVRNREVNWASEHGANVEALSKDKLSAEEKAVLEKITAACEKIDGENTKWLMHVVDERGWPTIAMVGKDGANAAWLLVQNADHNVMFQRKCLDLMAKLPKGEVSQSNLAYLTDRVLLAEGKKQIYGTQFTNDDGKFQPSPLDDEANVDKRRAEVGLEPLANYAETMKEMYGGGPILLSLPALEPYSLPASAERSITELAAQSDVLILGETHGTQEVPAIGEALLAPLTKLGYNALALEVPSDQRGPLIDWATGKTPILPNFFAKPNGDGRGNFQLLALVRASLLPPFRWQLICFDETDAAEQREGEELLKKYKAPKESQENRDFALQPDVIAMSLRRDASMASNLANQRQQLAPHAKVLAICGNLHARIANHAAADNPLSALWPSFAAVLQSKHTDWEVLSINIQPHSGGFFNGGKVNSFGGPALDHVEARPEHDGDYSLELGLPRATPATFFVAPR
ncbi:MAG TPA: DUF6624 domain-containing protein [Pirellulales bacterium]|nr:DUF6624 domain-containing protein [Pirellulales bacterium]